MPIAKKEVVFNSSATTNSYVNSPVATTLNYNVVLIYIKNVGSSNSLKYKILTTMDVDASTITWHTLRDETTLTATSEAKHKFTDPWDAVKVQVKSGTDDAHTNCLASINRK